MHNIVKIKYRDNYIDSNGTHYRDIAIFNDKGDSFIITVFADGNKDVLDMVEDDNIFTI